MPRSRAATLYNIGRETYQSTVDGDDALLRAIAAMLAEATKPKKRATSKAKSPIPPGKFFEILKESDHFALDTIPNSAYGRAGKMLSEIPDVTLADVETVVDWVEAGGIDWWTLKPTAKHILNNFPSWLAQAKAQENREKIDYGKLVR